MPISLARMFLAERARLIRAIHRIVGNRATAEDLAQDAFLRLWGRPGTVNARGLLFQTAHNLAIDHVRAQGVRAAYLGGIVEGQLRGEMPSPETAVGAREELDGFLAALRSLPERAQRAFLLNRLDGLSYADIADMFGVSISTIEKDIARALLLCRNRSADRRP